MGGPSLIRQLFACCSEELRHSLSRTTGGTHFAKPEPQLLALIKQLAVRYQNPAVHVQEFLGLVQHQDEGVRHFVTRLRGVAARCNFVENCSCDRAVSYADSMIRFKLIAGLYDSEIKEDILSSEDKTLDDTVKAIEAKESGKIARNTVGASNNHPVATVKPVVHPVKRCGHCNRTGHTSQERTWQNCPAFEKECSNCQKKGHFKVVCKAKNRSRSKSTSEIQVETSSVDQIFGIEDKSDYLQVNSISFGELAALRYCLGKVAKEVNNKRSIIFTSRQFHICQCWLIQDVRHAVCEVRS